MARIKSSGPEEIADAPSEVAPAIASKTIKFTAFKTYTSLGRRLAGDVDDFPASEADYLIANGDAVECS